jgi:hypothetical protein
VATRKISVTELDEALARRNKQKRLTAWLDAMDRRDPMSPRDVAAGEKLWQRIVASSSGKP